MNKNFEEIIENDLGIKIDEIRNTPWKQLKKRRLYKLKKLFRPRISDKKNFSFALEKEMGMVKVVLSEMVRKVSYNLRCLLKNKRNV